MPDDFFFPPSITPQQALMEGELMGLRMKMRQIMHEMDEYSGKQALHQKVDEDYTTQMHGFLVRIEEVVLEYDALKARLTRSYKETEDANRIQGNPLNPAG